ncbi:hypothetical protein PC129_g18329 [Phytophthora cactorum]|uniref:DDE-1 domain-containing protein n=2 Tax=Phytophthora cactorum TaxID=29920 RepID=A0A8T1BCC2_9STRA|nr:hypothetical protein Pcac1_g21670 [Phytophthora cactorum]KAG2802706.1 hypothetical protein PC112_g19515 [Phytophthora cactorum]KAG2803531.1 hypothetical protein PC111_g18647 [Phytophthora cactorum]KAG2843633.1 hypothetical protein PC113_g18573 [Phytophthora cactorum]KAG2899197.1 hypothetical protein PC115_g16611 [Phytophthora cactorum]
MLVFLPPNATHLLQPLDIAVFATLKNKIRKLIDELLEEDDEGYFTISKDDAIKVSSLAWKGSKIARNNESGFKACGLFPLSLVKMRARLEMFKRNGAPRHVQLATWLQMKTIVEDEILKLPIPPHTSTGQKRKRVEVGGRLLTYEVLLEIEATKASTGASKRKKSSKVVPSVPVTIDIVEFALV